MEAGEGVLVAVGGLLDRHAGEAEHGQTRAQRQDDREDPAFVETEPGRRQRERLRLLGDAACLLSTQVALMPAGLGDLLVGQSCRL
jgi:hypothetical protein